MPLGGPHWQPLTMTAEIKSKLRAISAPPVLLRPASTAPVLSCPRGCRPFAARRLPTLAFAAMVRRMNRAVHMVFALLPTLAAAQEPGTQEPPASYFFEAGGKNVPVELDKPFDPRALGGVKSATLRVGPHRTFAYGGLELAYPRAFTFEATLKPKVSMWTLSGNDCKVMVHAYPAAPDVDDLRKTVVASLIKALGKEGAKESATQLEVAGKKLAGTRLEFTVSGTRITHDLFAVKSGGGAVILILQDSPGDERAVSDERVEVGKLLAATLKLPK
jgi:hypothetical protein